MIGQAPPPSRARQNLTGLLVLFAIAKLRGGQARQTGQLLNKDIVRNMLALFPPGNDALARTQTLRKLGLRSGQYGEAP
jgi:hypothetical protein